MSNALYFLGLGLAAFTGLWLLCGLINLVWTVHEGVVNVNLFEVVFLFALGPVGFLLRATDVQ